eukprot:COSAG02_NODE_4191_length_5645_cov_5.454922_6_plen_128_part_01
MRIQSRVRALSCRKLLQEQKESVRTSCRRFGRQAQRKCRFVQSVYAEHGRICGGSNFASVWKVECTAWGGTFLVALAAAGVVYAAGGVAYNIKVRGLSGLDALPHRDFWQELGAYVKDGVDFSRARAL